MHTLTSTPTIAPAFTLDITRRVYATCLMTGARTGYLVRNFTLVG